jgi:hypothetical protein
MTIERKEEIYWNIQLRTLAAEHRLERLKADLIDLDRDRLIARVYD